MTKAEGQGANEVIIENSQVVRLSDAGRYLYGQLADIYFSSWNHEGLCDSLDQAERKISSFDPEEAYFVSDLDSGLALAIIHTLPIQAPSVRDLCLQFPTYSAVEQASTNLFKAKSPNFRICFSITALPGFRILRGESSQSVSLSQYLIKSLPQDKEVRQIAYSRYSNITPDTKLVDYYLANLDNPKMLGPVGLHEHLGGLAVAFIEGSRPEDTRGGGGNILVLYPNSDQEKQKFDQIKKTRLTTKILGSTP